MNASRLGKLAALTKGAAVVGIGLAGSACTKSGDAQPPTINAPATVTVNAPPPPQPPTMNATAQPVPVDPPSHDPPPPSASTGRRLPVPNALPPRGLRGDGGPTL